MKSSSSVGFGSKYGRNPRIYTASALPIKLPGHVEGSSDILLTDQWLPTPTM